MIAEHEHKAGRFDPDRCRACANDAGLLDHDEHVQLHERALLAAVVALLVAVLTG